MKKKSALIKLLTFTLVVLLSSFVSSARCLLLINGKVYDVGGLNCQDISLGVSDVCRDVYAVSYQPPNSGNSSTDKYVEFKSDKFLLSTDEGQAKFDALVKANNGKIDIKRFAKELAPIEAKGGRTSQARLDAIYKAAKMTQSK